MKDFSFFFPLPKMLVFVKAWAAGMLENVGITPLYRLPNVGKMLTNDNVSAAHRPAKVLKNAEKILKVGEVIQEPGQNKSPQQGGQ